MEIRNTTLFFAGIAAIILGTFVIIFDYPQIQYLDSIQDPHGRDILQRLQIEIMIGVAIFIGGMALLAASFLARFQHGIK